MSQALNNPIGASHRDYGATASTSSTVTPEVSFASGFSPTEFVSLSEDIAQNIIAINAGSKQLERALKVMSASNDVAAQREKVHKTNEKTKNHVDAASRDLQRLTAVVRRGDHQQKIQLDKLTSEFHTVLKNYSRLQQSISSVTRRSYEQAAAVELEAEQSLHAEQLQQQTREATELQQEHDMLIERHRQVVMLERDIIDVNAIVGKLNTMVHEQGEQLETLATNIERASTNVEAGSEELAKAARSRQSYRRKILILLAIAVIIGLIVTGIVVGKLNS